MAEDINSCNFSGNITREPELRMTTNETQVLSFSLAVNSRRKRGGSWEDVANFPRFVLYGNRAEALKAYLHKGTKVFVTASLHEYPYERNGMKLRGTEFEVSKLVMVGGRKQAEPTIELDTSDIPF